MAAEGPLDDPPAVEEAGHGRHETPDPLHDFVAVMRRLRAECPWKAAQTHRSLSRYLLEETHETLEALDSGDADHLREELGDLLLQVVFHAAIAEEAGEFTLDDVAAGVAAKMRSRNPHVFGPDGSPRPTDPAAVNELWEQVKAGEKQRESVTDGLPPTLPALLYADKVLDRLGRDRGEAAVVPEAEPGADAEARLGRRLLSLVAEVHADGVDPEAALRRAVRDLL